MHTNGMPPMHPGEYLREEYLEPLNMSVHALATNLRVPATRISEIMHARRSITPDTALRLARYFNTTAAFWINLQAAYDLRIAATSMEKIIQREVTPYSPPAKKTLGATKAKADKKSVSGKRASIAKKKAVKTAKSKVVG